VQHQQQLKMPRSIVRGFFLGGADVETLREVRTCLACQRDFTLSLDQDPETVFFCAECSRPPAPGDELGVGG